METTHAAGHDHGRQGRREDWSDEEFVKTWIERQKDREPERHRQFVLIRALIPKTHDQEFSYVNIGAGPGNLARFEGRVEYVQANLDAPGWAEAVGGPFDVAVSSIAIHNIGAPRRIRSIYAETRNLLGHGGVFLNLDYVRPLGAELAPLAAWAGKDPEAGFIGRGGGSQFPGTLVEQVGWLSEAGFATVDVPWKEMNVAIFCAVRDHLHMPDAEDHAHSHETHAHSH